MFFLNVCEGPSFFSTSADKYNNTLVFYNESTKIDLFIDVINRGENALINISLQLCFKAIEIIGEVSSFDIC